VARLVCRVHGGGAGRDRTPELTGRKILVVGGGFIIEGIVVRVICKGSRVLL
jgi:hypothetical protein